VQAFCVCHHVDNKRGLADTLYSEIPQKYDTKRWISLQAINFLPCREEKKERRESQER